MGETITARTSRPAVPTNRRLTGQGHQAASRPVDVIDPPAAEHPGHTGKKTPRVPRTFYTLAPRSRL
jgi:hypothetical protein